MFSDAIITETIGALKDPILIMLTLFLMGVMLIIWKGFLPIYKNSKEARDAAFIKKTDAEIEIEKMHAQRQMEEVAVRERRDKERSEMEGRWLELTERSTSMQSETNRVVEAMTNELKAMREQTSSAYSSLKALNDSILESREGSKIMAGKVDAIFDYVIKR